MKKSHVLILLSLILLLRISFSLAQDPGDVSGVLGDEFNISADKIPTDPEEIKNEYLKKEWGELLKNNSVIGPVHTFFTKIPIVFKVVFAHEYELSPTFFLIVVIWILIALEVASVFKSWGIVKGGMVYPLGIGAAIIIAQSRLIYIFANFCTDIAFRSDKWWARLIIWVVIFGAIIMEYYLSKIISNVLKKMKKKKTEAQFEQSTEEAKGFADELHQKYT